jgi:hypothetical protein
VLVLVLVFSGCRSFLGRPRATARLVRALTTLPPTYIPTYLPYLLYLYFHTFVLLLLLLLFISISISISIILLLLLLLPHWEHTFPSLTLVNLIPGFSNI